MTVPPETLEQTAAQPHLVEAAVEGHVVAHDLTDEIGALLVPRDREGVGERSAWLSHASSSGACERNPRGSLGSAGWRWSLGSDGSDRPGAALAISQVAVGELEVGEVEAWGDEAADERVGRRRHRALPHAGRHEGLRHLAGLDGDAHG